MAQPFDPGDGILISVQVYDANRAPVDPATLALHLSSPDGSQTTITSPDSRIAHLGTGSYEYEHRPPVGGHAPGLWQWYWISTSPDQEEPGSLVVRARSF